MHSEGHGPWRGTVRGTAGQTPGERPPALSPGPARTPTACPVPLHAATSLFRLLGELSIFTGCSSGGRTVRAAWAPLFRAGSPCGRGAAGGLVLERVTEHRGVQRVPRRWVSRGEPQSWLSASCSLARELGLLRTVVAAAILLWFKPSR